MIESLKPSYEPGRIDKEAPEKIWLQIDIDADKNDRDDMLKVDGGITWCWESLGGLEIEYIRSDLVAELMRDAERYRWLRDSGRVEIYIATDENESGYGALNGHDDKDSAIDAAMKRDREG